jgi:hypothetical protein
MQPYKYSDLFEVVSSQLKGNYKSIFTDRLTEEEFEKLAELVGIGEPDYKFLLTFLNNNKTAVEGEELISDLEKPLKTFLSKNSVRNLSGMNLSTLKKDYGSVDTTKAIKDTSKEFQIVHIDDINQCMTLTKDSGWCVQQKHYASDYLSSGPLFMILRNGKRFALISFARKQFMDVHDNPLKKKDLDWIGDHWPDFKYETMLNDNGTFKTKPSEAELKKILSHKKDWFGDLNLTRLPVKSLPEGMKVDGTLDLTGTPIKALPNGLKANVLNIQDTSISELPSDLDVGIVYVDFGSPMAEFEYEKPTKVHEILE